MTPKEKAEELFDKMFEVIFPSFSATEEAKQSALIAVYEILNMDYPHSDFQDLDLHISYWEEVKQEIKKI